MVRGTAPHRAEAPPPNSASRQTAGKLRQRERIRRFSALLTSPVRISVFRENRRTSFTIIRFAAKVTSERMALYTEKAVRLMPRSSVMTAV